MYASPMGQFSGWFLVGFRRGPVDGTRPEAEKPLRSKPYNHKLKQREGREALFLLPSSPLDQRPFDRLDDGSHGDSRTSGICTVGKLLY